MGRADYHCHFRRVTSIPLKGVAVHRDHVIADASVHGPGMGFGTGGSQSREQRQQVFIPWLGLHRIWMLLAVVEEGFRVPRFQLLCDPA